jgi:uncharacterized beta-barrel protein YwiB (DUF1934 family)
MIDHSHSTRRGTGVSEVKKIKKTVMVDICLTQCLNGYDPFIIEEEAQGCLYKVDPNTYILAYDTYILGKRVTTTLKASNGTVSIVRIGDVHSRQTFSVNDWNACQYFMEGGSIVCRNFTKKLDFSLGRDEGIVDILYELWSGETHLGYFNMEVFFS